MKYTITLIDDQNHESLDRGLAYEKFLLGPSNSSAPLELQSYGVKIAETSPIARIEPVHIHAEKAAITAALAGLGRREAT